MIHRTKSEANGDTTYKDVNLKDEAKQTLITREDAVSKAGQDQEDTSFHTSALKHVGRADRSRRARLSGWRFGVACAACATVAVMLLNIVFLIAATVKFGSEDGIITAIDGNCAEVDSFTTYLHILINALSSTLLAASNYTQQAVISPLRSEIDIAHNKGTWLDIGVPTVRNVFGQIAWKRKLAWWVSSFCQSEHTRTSAD